MKGTLVMRGRTLRRTVLAASIATVTALVATGCGGSDSDSAGGGGKELNIYAWAGEIPETVVKRFEKEAGMRASAVDEE